MKKLVCAERASVVPSVFGLKVAASITVGFLTSMLQAATPSAVTPASISARTRPLPRSRGVERRRICIRKMLIIGWSPSEREVEADDPAARLRHREFLGRGELQCSGRRGIRDQLGIRSGERLLL